MLYDLESKPPGRLNSLSPSLSVRNLLAYSLRDTTERVIRLIELCKFTFQLLGCMLGIEDWARTFQRRTEIPEDCVEKPLRLDAGFGEAEVIEVC